MTSGYNPIDLFEYSSKCRGRQQEVEVFTGSVGDDEKIVIPSERFQQFIFGQVLFLDEKCSLQFPAQDFIFLSVCNIDFFK